MDRVAMLGVTEAADVGHKPGDKRRGPGGAVRTSSKVPRTDSSDGSMMDVCCTQGTVSDSAQSNFGPPAAPAAATPAPDYAGSLPASVQQCVRHADDCSALMDAEQLVASEDFELSGSEVDGPVVVDKYIKGTRLIINGWFQACRGCNEPTSRTADIGSRDVPLCPRCQHKYNGMVSGDYPPNVGPVDTCVEPLSYWLPRMLGSMPRMTPQARRDFCDQLVLRQDDAWLALIKSS